MIPTGFLLSCLCRETKWINTEVKCKGKQERVLVIIMLFFFLRKEDRDAAATPNDPKRIYFLLILKVPTYSKKV